MVAATGFAFPLAAALAFLPALALPVQLGELLVHGGTLLAHVIIHGQVLLVNGQQQRRVLDLAAQAAKLHRRRPVVEPCVNQLGLVLDVQQVLVSLADDPADLLRLDFDEDDDVLHLLPRQPDLLGAFADHRNVRVVPVVLRVLDLDFDTVSLPNSLDVVTFFADDSAEEGLADRKSLFMLAAVPLLVILDVLQEILAILVECLHFQLILKVDIDQQSLTEIHSLGLSDK
mmetsp:Transcript_88036/g.269335  ORF Transcript_88036/g.269335 Transcript_88036/m.269335 type:complete len:230 (+) Transcript_88036:260-949(+)